ncbi:hypothetical protein [Actinoplanes sp. NPDC051859]|uniref:hypothetical protein n=1 Tax=Actinoplanes sp. NPDC051859 TaxID=3363909 RepID=UPI00379ED47B
MRVRAVAAALLTAVTTVGAVAVSSSPASASVSVCSAGPGSMVMTYVGKCTRWAVPFPSEVSTLPVGESVGSDVKPARVLADGESVDPIGNPVKHAVYVVLPSGSTSIIRPIFPYDVPAGQTDSDCLEAPGVVVTAVHGVCARYLVPEPHTAVNVRAAAPVGAVRAAKLAQGAAVPAPAVRQQVWVHTDEGVKTVYTPAAAPTCAGQQNVAAVNATWDDTCKRYFIPYPHTRSVALSDLPAGVSLAREVPEGQSLPGPGVVMARNAVAVPMSGGVTYTIYTPTADLSAQVGIAGPETTTAGVSGTTLTVQDSSTAVTDSWSWEADAPCLPVSTTERSVAVQCPSDVTGPVSVTVTAGTVDGERITATRQLIVQQATPMVTLKVTPASGGRYTFKAATTVQGKPYRAVIGVQASVSDGPWRTVRTPEDVLSGVVSMSHRPTAVTRYRAVIRVGASVVTSAPVTVTVGRRESRIQVSAPATVKRDRSVTGTAVLTFDGKPAAGQKLVLTIMMPGAKAVTRTAKTDGKGKIAFTVRAGSRTGPGYLSVRYAGSASAWVAEDNVMIGVAR